MDEDVPERTVSGRKVWVTKQLADMGILNEYPGDQKGPQRTVQECCCLANYCMALPQSQA
ncbi:hypothetical protein K435DRAFT_778762 [Dendrothele bispora CBS 962.96]|uniref:Uncharacterized protein n=1 Tax=Dendrothele bispora (strain CBS 962.96) TaxID=1314807 RepID=A0A4S8M2R9_DENBC|nr:hypothetical protein K435DRAFT_778762 [Dendrothele bispora CBS 962.96]